MSEYSEIVFQKRNGLCATWNPATTCSAKSDYSDTLLADNDPTSRRMMEGILANEEEHAEDMKALLETIGKEEKQRDHR